MSNYNSIDMNCTGKRLKYYLKKHGYSVKMVQEYLHLACPQPIYRCFKGQTLPSVDHLLMLSRLVNVHMEELLVMKMQIIMATVEIKKKDRLTKRILAYSDLMKAFSGE